MKVQKILDEMDVKAPQVALSTVIGELTLTNDEEFGVDYFQRVNDGRTAPRSSLGTAGGVFRAAARRPTPTAVRNIQPAVAGASAQLDRTGTGSNVYLAAGIGLSAIVRALDSTRTLQDDFAPDGLHDATTRKRLSPRAGNSGAGQYHLRAAPAAIVGGLAQQSNIQFKKVALQLEVVPLINSEKEVTLDILQKLDSVASFTEVDNNRFRLSRPVTSRPPSRPRIVRPSSSVA